MTDKELRRLKRAELFEILYYLQKENEELRAELQIYKEKSAQNQGSLMLPEEFMQQLNQMIQEAVHAEQKSVSEDTEVFGISEHTGAPEERGDEQQ